MSNLVPAAGGSAPVGMDDFDPNKDGSTGRARVRIGQDEEGVLGFISGLESWMMTDTIDRIILLGLVKSRVLWHHDLEAHEGPLCRSFDHASGHASPDFLDMDSYHSQVDVNSLPTHEETGLKLLSCMGDCTAHKFGTHPTRDNTPYCAEQFNFPAIVIDENGGEQQIILTFQRSGLKAPKALLTRMHRLGQSLFTVEHKITLEKKRMGQVRYATPKFHVGDNTDPDRADEFATLYFEMRDYLRTPPKPKDGDNEDGTVVTAVVVNESRNTANNATADAAFGADPTAPMSDDDEVGF